MKNQSNVRHRLSSSQKAQSIFDAAMKHYQKNHFYLALQTARYALKLARKNQDYLRAYINGFIALIKMELGQKELAAYYCKQAIQSLFSYHPDYKSDLRYYLALLKEIEKK